MTVIFSVIAIYIVVLVNAVIIVSVVGIAIFVPIFVVGISVLGEFVITVAVVWCFYVE